MLLKRPQLFLVVYGGLFLTFPPGAYDKSAIGTINDTPVIPDFLNHQF